MAARQAYGVFVESLERESGSTLEELWLELPAEPARLVEREGAVVTVGLDDVAPGEIDRSLIFETVRHEKQPYLAMLAPLGVGVRVNGVIASAASVLRVRDQVELNGAFLLHVSQFSRPYHGPALAEHAQRECPVCLTPIAAGSLVFVWSNCQTALHAQGEETPVADRLECHLSSSCCPCCNQPLTREEGFAYVPKL